MSDVTRILSAIEQGDAHAAEQLLPLVYDELRKLAAQKIAAASEAMRRILVEKPRHKQADKRGGKRRRVAPEAVDSGYAPPDEEILAIDEALGRLAVEDVQAARLIQLRYFGGLSIEEAAEVVGLSRSSAYEHWAYERLRLRCLLQGE
jgi:DNA-directed RNA polymerase specialized sigma24 family protein